MARKSRKGCTQSGSEPFTLDEVRKLFRAAKMLKKDRNLLLLQLYATTGGRAIELCKLKYKDLIKEKKLDGILIGYEAVNDYMYQTAKVKKFRRVMLFPEVQQLLLDVFHQDGCQLDRFIFRKHPVVNNTEEHIDARGVWYLIDKYCKLAGVKKEFYGAHSFRKFYAHQIVYNSGMQLHDALTFLMMDFNHSSLRQTADYCGINYVEADNMRVNALGNIFF